MDRWNLRHCGDAEVARTIRKFDHGVMDDRRAPNALRMSA